MNIMSLVHVALAAKADQTEGISSLIRVFGANGHQVVLSEHGSNLT